MYWNYGFIIGGVIVLIVAVLLITILLVARNIRRLATEALSVAGEIETNTKPIWAVAGANEIVQEIALAAQSLEGRVKGIQGVLERS